MPNYRHCQNCFAPKDPARYSEYLCETCEKAAREAENYAAAENLDPGAERRKALASRAPSAMSGKTVTGPLERIDTQSITERLNRVPDNDPRFVR